MLEEIQQLQVVLRLPPFIQQLLKLTMALNEETYPRSSSHCNVPTVMPAITTLQQATAM